MELDINIRVFSLARSASGVGNSNFKGFIGASGNAISNIIPCLRWKNALLIVIPLYID
jgi:hypothetical protein